MLKATIVALSFFSFVSLANAKEAQPISTQDPDTSVESDDPSKPPEWVCVLAPQLCGDKKPPVARP